MFSAPFVEVSQPATSEHLSVCIAVGVERTLYMHVMDYVRSNIYRGLNTRMRWLTCHIDVLA